MLNASSCFSMDGGATCIEPLKGGTKMLKFNTQHEKTEGFALGTPGRGGVEPVAGARGKAFFLLRCEMGLDTTHGCWSGPYSMFMRWRVWLAQEIGIPIGLMEGFYEWTWEEGDLEFDKHYTLITSTHSVGNMWWDTLAGFRSLGRPISWEALNEHPLVPLLNHSDCDGKIHWWKCKGIAIALLDVIRNVADDTEYPRYLEGPNAGQLIWNDWRDGRGTYDGNVPATKRFLAGCVIAYKSREHVRFH
jgi:hypothetical protein